MAQHRTEKSDVSSPGTLDVFLRAKREDHCSSSAEDRKFDL